MEQVIEISSREFREKQKAYFDLADNGAQIILKRGRKQAYIPDNDLELSPEPRERIKKGLEEIKTGKTTRYTMDELQQRLGL
ncbi:MAG: hypothetical protein LBG96_15215 [Tannerella sp.]|jgi:hypothetical protein|nr:hypothetical protein [Tannerella sp.]